MFKLEAIKSRNSKEYGFEILREGPLFQDWNKLSLDDLNTNTLNQLFYISESIKCKDRKIFVNVERKQMFDEKFCYEAELLIKRINALNTKVVLEVTERGETGLSDWKLFKDIKKKYDFKLAADDVKNVKDVRKSEIDFGVYDYVKMEPFFLEGSAAYSRETCVDTIDWMFNLTRKLGLNFIAEMIESKEILEEAKKYPFSYFQGYYFKTESIK